MVRWAGRNACPPTGTNHTRTTHTCTTHTGTSDRHKLHGHNLHGCTWSPEELQRPVSLDLGRT